MEQEKVKNKRENNADKDLYDIMNSDVKISKELEDSWGKDFEEISKKIKEKK